jgi:hypothetical protein
MSAARAQPLAPGGFWGGPRPPTDAADTAPMTDPPQDKRRWFVGAMAGPRGGWPVAYLEIRSGGEVRLQGEMTILPTGPKWKLRPPALTWQPGLLRAENVRGALTGRHGVRLSGSPGPQATLWCGSPKDVLSALAESGVPTVWHEQPPRVWRWTG